MSPVPAYPWRLIDAGKLVTLDGTPLTWSTCRCGRLNLGETCPCSIPCPQCHAPASRTRCLRPSGHESNFHGERVQAAVNVDSDRERAGDPSLPEPWPAPRTQPAAPEPVASQLDLFPRPE